MEKLTQKEKPTIYKNWMFGLISLVFLVVTIWWLLVHPFDSANNVDLKNWWSSTYVAISLLGGIFGVYISKSWGGLRSVIGRAILAFSVGLFLQSFGQVVYNYFTLVKNIQAPYPSLGDVGYFGSILAYIYGGVLLGRATGLKFSLRSTKYQILGILLPLIMLILSYIIFLKDYTFTASPLTTFFDFGYPLGQAIYVSIALLVLYVSQKFLGGIMKKPVMLLLTALVVQYICDFDFLFKFSHNTWYAGGPGDYLYAISYLLMTVSLISFGHASKKIKATS